jgi:tetratricopeptide (TPR) repeat protein
MQRIAVLLIALGLAAGAPAATGEAEAALLERGIALFRDGNAREAEPLLRRAVERSPEDPVGRFYLGQLLLTQHRLEEADLHLQASLRVRPDYAPLHYALSHLYAERGEMEGSLAAAERAVELDPGSAAHHHQAGQVLTLMGRRRQAMNHFIKVAELGAPSEGIAFDAGVALFTGSDYARATLAFEAAVAHNPGNLKALDYLGACYRLKGRNEKALEIYQRALVLAPEDPIAHYGIGVLHIKRGETELAVRRMERSLSIDPKNAFAHYKLGKLRLLQGDPAGAAASFERALELSPDFKNVLYNLGLAYMRLGEEEKGRRVLARFEEMKKRDRPALAEGGVSTSIPEDEL